MVIGESQENKIFKELLFMSLSVYEKHNVEAGKSCLVMGKVTFNVLNQPRTQKPNEYVSNPRPEYVVAVESPKYVKGDENLINALKETQYGADKNLLSVRDKSPFPPMIFGKDNDKQSGDKLIPEGQCLKNGQQVLIHVTTFKGHGNVGCGFDAVKLTTPLNEVQLQTAGGKVSADVFDL